MAPKIERVTDSFGLGEGPHWDIPTQSLYMLDFIGLHLVRYNPKTNKVSKASTAPKHPSFIIPVDNKPNHFIVSLDKDLVIVRWDGESDQFTTVQQLCTVDSSAVNKFNDGKCDSSGRLWTGTLNLTLGDLESMSPVGTLYSFDSQKGLKGHVDKIRCTNGLEFNDKTKKMFYIDSLKRTVDRFDFDIVNGVIANREVWFTLEKYNILGIPDGMTTDTDGNLWVAVFGGSRVIKIDGNKAETLLDTIEMPALQITSVAFGGTNLDELYVTSATVTVDGKTPPAPANGAVYRVTGTGSTGLPANNFKLN